MQALLKEARWSPPSDLHRKPETRGENFRLGFDCSKTSTSLFSYSLFFKKLLTSPKVTQAGYRLLCQYKQEVTRAFLSNCKVKI